MKTFSTLMLSLALACAQPLAEEQNIRERRDITRETKVGDGTVFGKLGVPETGGAQGMVGYKGNLMNNNYGRVDGQAHITRTLGLPGGPQTGAGGRLDWTGSRGAASVDVMHTRGLGTQLDAQARGTLHQFDKNTKIEGYGGYSQHFGGPGRHQRPNYGFGATFRRKFR